MIKYYNNLEQGTQEWLKARLGILTASNVKTLFTGKGAQAKGAGVNTLALILAGQRATGFVEQQFETFQMARGHREEVIAKEYYSKLGIAVSECGFITRDFGKFTLGYSPDGLVCDDGLIEIKSRVQKYQVETIINDIVPAEFMMQCQTGLLVTQREWIDFVSYSNGMPLFVKRVFPDAEIQKSIMDYAEQFETLTQKFVEEYEYKSKAFMATNFIEQNSEEGVIEC